MSGLLQFLANAVFVLAVIFIWLMILYQFVLTIGGYLMKRRTAKSAPSASPAELPNVSILVPARNEEKVIGGLLERLAGLDYPGEKIEIIVIDDGSTDRTREIAAAFCRRDARIKILTIPAQNGGRGKGAALNRGLELASHDIIAVYDSDNIPEPGSLKKLCLALGDDLTLAGVTGKFRAYNRNRNILTGLVNLEAIAFQWIIQAGRSFFFKIAFLPGTNFILRRSAVIEAGDWDEEALTEDSELTFRLYQKKYRIKFLPTATTWEQEPENLKTWVRQRTRWARGNNHIIAKHGKELFRSRPSPMILEIFNILYLYYFFVFAVIFSDLFFVLSAFKAVRLQVVGPFRELWVLAFFLFILEILLALSFEGEDSFKNLGLAVLAYLAYTKLWAFVVLRSLYEEFIARKEPVWAKTERMVYETAKVGFDHE